MSEITREWFVLPSHARAALAEWCALRAAENRRAADRLTRDDAMAGPDTLAMHDDPNALGSATVRTVPSVKRTVNPLADRASQVMPISGIHSLPVFGKGETVSPFIGDRTPTDGADWDSVDAWGYVAEHTMGDAFTARVMHIMTSEAVDAGRAVDWPKLPDVMSVAREGFVNRVRDLMTRDDVYRMPPGSDTSDTVGGVGEWGVPRAMRCGECEGCERARASESANRASRYSLKGCDAPRTVVEWVTPSRILSRAVWAATGDRTLATSSVYATRSQSLRTMAAMLAQDERVNADNSDPLAHIPQGVADLLRLVAATCALTGDNVVSHNGGLSPAARSILCMALGVADSKAGATTAMGRLRTLYRAEQRRAFIGPRCTPGACAHDTCQGSRVNA